MKGALQPQFGGLPTASGDALGVVALGPHRRQDFLDGRLAARLRRELDLHPLQRERAERARLRVDLREVPGADVATLLGKLSANIDEVQLRRR